MTIVTLKDVKPNHKSPPIVSLGSYLAEKSTQNLIETAQDVEKALDTCGAFYLVEHGLDAEKCDKVLRDLKTFFELPLNEKKIYELKDQNAGRGYIPFATQNGNAYSGRAGFPNDLFERFHFGSTKPLISGFVQAPGDYIEGWAPNVYAPCFRDSFIAYYETLHDMAFWLKKIFSTALGEQEDFLEKMTNRANPMVKANYYPVCERLGPEQPRLAEHIDAVPITIMLMDNTVNGLCAQNVLQEWMYINPPSNALLVLVGECMAILTNDHWPATPHYVPYPEDRSQMTARVSLPYFMQMNRHSKLGSLAKFVDPEKKQDKRYEPTTYHRIMHERMRRLVETTVEKF
uniref:Uncharacterized protein n=1 Tax=Romanomermis culicivorax TaxID=13658 RepID=A0A915KEJ6_ROMCU